MPIKCDFIGRDRPDVFACNSKASFFYYLELAPTPNNLDKFSVHARCPLHRPKELVNISSIYEINEQEYTVMTILEG